MQSPAHAEAVHMPSYNSTLSLFSHSHGNIEAIPGEIKMALLRKVHIGECSSICRDRAYCPDPILSNETNIPKIRGEAWVSPQQNTFVKQLLNSSTLGSAALVPAHLLGSGEGNYVGSAAKGRTNFSGKC